MSKVCTDLRQSLPVQKNIEFVENRLSEDAYADNFGENRKTPWYQNLTAWMGRNIFGKTDLLTVDDQRKYLYSQMDKNQAEHKMLVTNMQAMLQANPNVVPHFWKWVQSELNLVDAKQMRERFPEFEVKMITNPDGKEVPHLDTVPTGFLKVIHAELHEWINGGKIFPKTTGILHNIQVELMTPSTIQRRDPSGLIAEMNSGLEIWNSTAQARAADFYNESTDGKRAGINQINNKIKEFADSFGNVPLDVAFDMFIRFKRGEAFINPNDNDKLYISEKYIRPRRGEKHKWLRDKDSIKPYTWLDESNNEFEVTVSNKPPKGFKQSQQEMLIEANKMLIQWYDSVFQTIQTYTEAHNKRRAKIDKIARDNDTVDLIDEVSNFAIFSENLDVQGLTKVDKQEKYYMTRMYYQDQIPRLMEEALEGPHGMKAKRDMLTSKLREWDPSVKHSKTEINKQLEYERRLDELNADIYILEEKLNKMNEGLYDPQNREYIQAQNVLQNFKRVTELIHPKHARTDSNVLRDYIDGLFRTIQRNQVTLDFMEALASKGKEAKPGVVDYAINHYKSSFYFPDAETSYLGMKTDAQTWARRLNNIGMTNVTPQSLSNGMRSVSSYFIFNALNGPLQGMTNYSNYVLKVHEMGIDRMTRVLDEFDRNPEYWNKLAGKAGVTQFTSFVEGYVQRGLRDDEIAAMQGEMTLLKDEISRLDATNNPKRLIRLKKKLDAMKGSKWNDRASAAAQWAITRNITYRKNEVALKKLIKSTLGQMYGKAFPSIADTEENLRTLSFMIGVTNYIEANPGTRAEDTQAIQAGIDYTQRTDFGLSHQHVGLAFRGPLGGFLTRMRIWHVQRFGHDIQVYKQAFRQTRPEMLIRNEDGTYEMDDRWLSRAVNTSTGMYRLFKGIMTPPGSMATKQRLDKQYMARARSHFWLHAVATGIMDFGLFALAPPGTGTFMSYVAKGSRIAYYRSPMGRGLNGFGSSAMSLTFGAMHLLGIMATGGFEDKEYTPEQFFQKYAYHIPYFGLGASVMLDLTLGAVHNHRLDDAMGKHSYLTNHKEKLKVATPGGRIPWDMYKFMEELGITEKNKDVLETNWRR